METLEFTTVRGRKWTLDVDLEQSQEIVEHKIYQSIKKNAGLMSSDIDFAYDLEEGRGQIVVGGVRAVGTITALSKATGTQPKREGE